MTFNKYLLAFFLVLPSLFLAFCNQASNTVTKPASTVDSNFIEPTSTMNGQLILKSNACYISSIDSFSKKLSIVLSLPTTKEIDEIKSIISYVGLPQNFSIYQGDVANAMATMIDGKRIIVYNKDLLRDLDSGAGYWSSMFIIAHEIGHHLAYNLSDTTDPLNAELQADFFAGSTLYKMGANVDEAIEAVKSNYISRNYDSKTHPSKPKRVEMVARSWNEASQLRYNSADPPEPSDNYTGYFFNGEWEFDQLLLYDIPLTNVFGPFHKENASTKLGGTLLQIDTTNYEQDFSEVDQSEITVRVRITKDSSDHSLFDDIEIGQKRWLYVALPNRFIERKGLYSFLKPGRKIKFSIIRTRPAKAYIYEIGFADE